MTTTFAIIGLCTFYSPNVLERVADYRGLTGCCPDCAGYAAMIGGPEWLGQTVYIARPGHRPEKFLVADVSNRDHLKQQRARGLVCEVDFPTAQRWRMRGPLTVRVALDGAQRGAMP